jgi:hypothetical protein
MAAIVFLITSCLDSKDVSPEYIGNWKTNEVELTIRTSPEKNKYEFTGGLAVFDLEIKSDNTATGKIGQAEFSNAKIKKNPGNPENTGISYIIKCGSIGKIFEYDPLAQKEVELWLCPLKNGKFESELRYTEGWAHFPMAGMVFEKDIN